MTMPCSLCGGPRGDPPPGVEGLGARLCSICLPPEAAEALARSSPPPAPPRDRAELLAELNEALEAPEEAPEEPQEFSLADLAPDHEVPSQHDDPLPLAALRRCLDEAHPVLLQEFLETLTLEQQATLREGAEQALEARMGLGSRGDPERVPTAWDRIARWDPERRQALADQLSTMPSAAPVVDWIATLQGPGERRFPRVGLGYEILRRLGDRVRQIHTRATYGKALLRAERLRRREASEPDPEDAARLEVLEARITRIERDQLPVYEGWIQEVADLCDFFESTRAPEAETPARARARRTAMRLAHSPAFTDLLERGERDFLIQAVLPALGGWVLEPPDS
jgi:hypothetical protein